jgi:PAP2 superfamily
MKNHIETLSQPSSGFLGTLRASISAHAIFLMPLAIYAAAYQFLHLLRPDLGAPHLFTGVALVFLFFIPVLFLGLGMMLFYHVARYVKPDSPTKGLIIEYKKFLSNKARLAQGLPALLIVSIMAFVFSDVQSNILTLQPQTWDATFADWDRIIHFGKQPWEWVQPVLGYAPITFLINLNYNMWFFSMMMLLIYFGFAQTASVARTRFFITYIAIWIISGNVLAVLFSSAGPCYFSRLGLSPDPYAGLMQYLRHVNETFPVWAVSLQDLLWQGHLQGAEGSVVSAMPSLHNGSALLFALAGFQINKFWGRVLTAHAVLIFFGSFHLGWHYAIDSYMAWTVTLIFWTVSKPIAIWWHTREVQTSFDKLLLKS